MMAKFVLLLSLLFVFIALSVSQQTQRQTQTQSQRTTSGRSECQQARDRAQQSKVVGRLVPQCDQNGEYAALQCHPENRFCQCWRRDGTPITQPSRKIRNCECIRAKDQTENIARPSSGRDRVAANNAFVPQCMEDGSYKKQQCHAGECWCVDSSGRQTSRNKVKGTVNCN